MELIAKLLWFGRYLTFSSRICSSFSRILSARSADEFYSCMGGGAGAVWDAGDALVTRVVAFGSAPELPRLRSIHRYRVAPPVPPAAAPIYQPPLHTAVSVIALNKVN